MLILTRRLGESITIGDDIKITFVDIRGNKVRVGIEAPKGVSVYREELYQVICEQNLQAARSSIIEKEGLSGIWRQLGEARKQNERSPE